MRTRGSKSYHWTIRSSRLQFWLRKTSSCFVSDSCRVRMFGCRLRKCSASETCQFHVPPDSIQPAFPRSVAGRSFRSGGVTKTWLAFRLELLPLPHISSYATVLVKPYYSQGSAQHFHLHSMTEGLKLGDILNRKDINLQLNVKLNLKLIHCHCRWSDQRFNWVVNATRFLVITNKFLSNLYAFNAAILSSWEKYRERPV